MAAKIAKYKGNCWECGGRILPGDPIVWKGPRKTCHAECDAPGGYSYGRSRGPVDDSPGALRSYYDPRGAYSADGTFLGTVGPRCEDAPCCGCCSP